MFFRILYRLDCPLQNLLTRHLQLVLHVNIGSCYESVNVLQVAFDSSVNVDLIRASKAENFGVQPLFYYRLDSLHLPMRYYWKPCLYCIDSQLIKPDRDLNLLVRCDRHSRCLFAVPESSIKDLNTFAVAR